MPYGNKFSFNYGKQNRNIHHEENILHLPNEIIVHITLYLNDKSKLSLLTTCKKLNHLKYLIDFNTLINIDKIIDISYFDSFTHIIVQDIYFKLPKRVKYLKIDNNLNDIISIPSSVKYLVFGDYFNQNIDKFLPNTITHLQKK